MLDTGFPTPDLPVGPEQWDEPGRWDEPFRVYRCLDHVAEADRGGIAALGNFDGVHSGHAWLIARAVFEARRLKVPASVLTFSPHPRKVLRNHAGFLLTDEAEKERLIRNSGVSALFVQTFDKAFAGVDAEEFVDEFLARRLGVRGVIVGSDFAFGRGRKGSIDFLVERGRRHGIAVRCVSKFADVYRLDHSSTRIRALLGAGDVVAASRLLGRYWRVSGRLHNAAGRPALSFGDLVRLPAGHYGGRVHIETGRGPKSAECDIEVRAGATPDQDKVVLAAPPTLQGKIAHVAFHRRLGGSGLGR